jgi:hypothetical protein
MERINFRFVKGNSDIMKRWQTLQYSWRVSRHFVI